MKISKYTKFIPSSINHYCYNSITNSLCKLDENLFAILRKAQEKNLELEFQDIQDNDIWESLIFKKIITNSDKNDLLFYKASISQMRKTSNILNLTLAPTMNCNFSCPYCFETKEAGIMSPEITKNIIKLVDNYNDIEHINLTWFGGEPLLATSVIEEISSKISKSDRYRYKASIITNGYFFTEENIDLIERNSIQTIQLSIDGIFEFHNKKRFTAKDKDTFSKILNNLDIFAKKDNNLNLVIRVNIDNENVKEYPNIRKFFINRYGHDKRISIQPAFIINTTKGNNEGSINEVSEKIEFLKEIYNLTGDMQLYPNNFISECAVRNDNSWAIDAKGNVYKCWEIMGNLDYKVGELTDKGIKITNDLTLCKYLYGADHLQNSKCNDCFSIFICGGGCPHKRIENEYNNKDFVLNPYCDNNIDCYIMERIKIEESK